MPAPTCKVTNSKLTPFSCSFCKSSSSKCKPAVGAATAPGIEIRAKELKIKYLYQEISEKTVILEEIIKKTGLRKEEIAYMGDDLNDVLIMKQVGLSGAPKDAVNEVIQIADFISEKNGGSGAVREFVEHILKKDGKWEIFLKNIK